MKDIIEKVVMIILLLVVMTFFINHGQIDFTYVDKAATLAKDTYYSDEGQEVVSELKDITINIVSSLASETKKIITDAVVKEERVKVSYVRTVDGDTLIVKLNDEEVTVRLIGIDTPESVNPDEEKNNDYGDLASEHTKELLNGVKDLYLEFDKEYEDKYGRLLAYVWLTDESNTSTSTIKNEMLNGIILRDGYAMDVKYEPNTKYYTSFSLIRKETQQNDNGLWKYEDFVNLWN